MEASAADAHSERSMNILQANSQSALRNQCGAALPLVAVGMLAMLAIVGLAVDTSHTLANKTRLQNTVDAAALAAAKTYDSTKDIFAGNASAMSLFGLNADGAGNHELNDAYDANEVNVVIQWSETLDPFISSGLGPYVRVIASGYDIDMSLSAVLGITEIDVGASAVAGPSPTINTACNIAPMVICAENSADPDFFGFTPGQLEVMKSASHQNAEIGPGNFQLIRLDCGSGKDCTRENLAGAYDGCATSGETVDTEPGNAVGPVAQGLNTRFGAYAGPMNGTEEEYPPDVVTTGPSPPLVYDDATDTIMQGGVAVTQSTINYAWDQYFADIQNPAIYDFAEPVGVHGRRVLAVPIAKCDGAATGQSTLDVVGFGCYFLLQKVSQQGNESYVFGQFIEGCKTNGVAGPATGSGPEPYLIQLYKDPDSGDS